MNLAVLQISDIHISSADAPVLARAKAIRSAVQVRLPKDCALVIAYTGDTAFSGTAREFEIAATFLESLVRELSEVPGIHVLGTPIIPGNHDCDFSVAGDARPVLLAATAAKLSEIDLGGESVQQLLKVQDQFFEFESKVTNRHPSSARDRVSWSFTYEHNGTRVLFRCLNSALFSKLSEKAGQLYFPLHAIPDLPPDADFVVTLLHHPYGWLDPDNSKQLRRAVDLISDLVLTGHEHDGDFYTRTTKYSDETDYVEAPALNAKGDTGFNLILVNLESHTSEIIPYKWMHDLYEPGQMASRMFTRKKSLVESRFENSSEFSTFLQDMGTGFSHPAGEISLRDLFVYPELRMVTLSSKSQTTVSSSSFFSFISNRNYLHITGAPNSGKSTLARALYLDFTQQRLVPILVEGQNIKGSSKDSFDKLIETAFGDQYGDSSYERFRQLDKNRKVLLVDDWHRSRLTGKRKNEILNTAHEIFGKVIIFSDEVSIFQVLVDSSETASTSDAEYAEIKQFGYRLRSELIRKWYSVGDDFEIDDLELTSQISTSENLLDTLVRKGIVPSWPIFILTVLQESSNTIEQTSSYGSYGHLYEALLTRRMAASSKRRSSLGMKYTYLSILAYRMFKASADVLSELQVREVSAKYETEYHVALDQKELWEELVAAQVLARTGDDFRFRYKYAYYFFVAKYFQEGIANVREASSLRSQLRYMAQCVHDEDYANILIFYIYLTKDRELIEKILEVASLIFSDKEPAQLTSDIEFVNKLTSRAPEILLERSDIEGNRDDYRARMDSAEEDERPPEPILTRTEYRNDISEILKIEFSFKSLQVMGQVVKNFPLDLRGDLKFKLTKESYELTLRTLREFLETIETNLTALLAVFDKAIRRFRPFSRQKDDEIRDVAQATVKRFAEFAIFGAIKRLSFAVGVVDLKETYEQVRQSLGEENLPARLIDLSIKLDHFGQIPESDVRDLEQRLRSNITAYMILKLLVADHLHLFPCDYKTEQRMVELFKFQPHVGSLAEKKVKSLT